METLLIALIALAMSTIFISYYLRIDDSTLALEITKISVLKNLGKLDELASIKNISYIIDGSTIDLDTQTTPDTLDNCEVLGLNSTLENAITEKTSFTLVDLKLNGVNC